MARKVLAARIILDLGALKGEKIIKRASVWVRTPQMHCRNGRYPFLDKPQGAWVPCGFFAGWAGAGAVAGAAGPKWRRCIAWQKGSLSRDRQIDSSALAVLVTAKRPMHKPIHVHVCALVSWQVQIYSRDSKQSSNEQRIVSGRPRVEERPTTLAYKLGSCSV